MRRLSLAFVFVLFPMLLSAQPITTYTLKTYNVGAPSPIQTFTFQASAVVCNQANPAIGVTANPTKVVWDDTVNAGKACIWTDPGTGPLFSVPFGGQYEGTLSQTNSAGTSVESARAPFTRPGTVPAPIVGLRFIGS
jgi:hypothetical protein